MNDDYQTYKQEYDHALSRVRSFLSSNVRSQTTLRECNRLISQARRAADAMEQMAQESSGNGNGNGNIDAFQMQESKRRIEQELDPLWQEVERAMQRNSSDEQMNMMHQNHQRADLFSGSGSGSGYRAPNANDNHTMEQDNDMEMLIRNSEDLLLESQRLCHSSEQTGSETLGLMGSQREQLQNASDHLAGARASLAQAKDVLRAMTRKALHNKRFLQCVVVMLIIANILVFIADVKKKLGKRSKNTSNP